jgi:hypothetical protein
MTNPIQAPQRILQVAIITNGNPNRLSTTLRTVNDFFQRQTKFSLDIRVIKWQNNSYSPPRRIRVFRTLVTLWAEIQAAVRFRKGAWRTFKICVSYGAGILKCFSGKSSENAKRSFAELALTDKHIRCLAGFMESEAEFLLVLEDDVSLSTETFLTPQALEQKLDELLEEPLFLSLTKAFTFEELGIVRGVEPHDDGFLRLPNGATNTTAAYVVNRPFVDSGQAYILDHPFVRTMPSDWMLTILMLRMKGLICLHAKSAPFLNGSLLGLTQSEIRP